MDRWLGEPLPHQLSNPTRAPPCAINLWYSEHAFRIRYAVLASVSGRYPPHKGRLLTRYSPVRHWSEDRSPHHRSTWMCYARRQRSSWARIKLSKICIISLSWALQSFSSFCSSFYFVWVVLLVWIVRDSTSHFFVCFVLISKQILSASCCSIFNDRFAVPSEPFAVPSRRRLDYYITSLPLCQYLFQKFFWFFQTFFLALSSKHPHRALSRTAPLLYYLSPLLSSGFLKVFSKIDNFFLDSIIYV